MATDPANRVALVTGANRGIGREVARQLATDGYHVIVTARDEAKGRDAADALADAGEVSFHPLDVTSVESIEALAAHLKDNVGRLDALVNNAGVFPDKAIQPWAEAKLADVKHAVMQAYETNSVAPLLLGLAVLPMMTDQGYGRIVNVSSQLGQFASVAGGNHPAYRSSKTALNALTLILAAEAPDGADIKINAVCPGWVRTDMGGANAARSVAEGADTIVWAATLPADGPTAGFFQTREPLDW